MPYTPQAIVLNTQLSDLVAGVRVPGLIGRQVAPVIPVTAIAGQSFTYWRKPAADRLLLPDTKVGRTGQVNMADYGYINDSGILADHGLRARIPNPIVRLNADQPPQVLQVPLNVRADYSNENAAAVWRVHEFEVASIVSTVGSYFTNYARAATSKECFDYVSSDRVNPLKLVQAMIDRCFSGANTLVFGHYAWRAFQRHPDVVTAIKGMPALGQVVAGTVTEQQVAGYFGIKQVIVGSTKANLAAKGVAPSYQRLWTNFLAALTIQDAPSSPDVAYSGFMATFFGAIMTGQPLFVFERNLDPGEYGVYGGLETVVGHTRLVKVINNQEGTLLTDCVTIATEEASF